MKTTWREELERNMKDRDNPGPVLAYAPNEASFDLPFDPFDVGALDGPLGPYVLAWTEQRVYFPVCHVDVQGDGGEWLDYAPRHPQAEGQRHIGHP